MSRSVVIPAQPVIQSQLAGHLPGILQEHSPCLVPYAINFIRALRSRSVETGGVSTAEIAKQKTGIPETFRKPVETDGRIFRQRSRTGPRIKCDQGNRTGVILLQVHLRAQLEGVVVLDPGRSGIKARLFLVALRLAC